MVASFSSAERTGSPLYGARLCLARLWFACFRLLLCRSCRWRGLHLRACIWSGNFGSSPSCRRFRSCRLFRLTIAFPSSRCPAGSAQRRRSSGRMNTVAASRVLGAWCSSRTDCFSITAILSTFPYCVPTCYRFRSFFRLTCACLSISTSLSTQSICFYLPVCASFQLYDWRHSLGSGLEGFAVQSISDGRGGLFRASFPLAGVWFCLPFLVGESVASLGLSAL